MFIIDQHAAHEKVLFERTMANIKKTSVTSQSVNPPLIVTLSLVEAEVMEKNMEYFQKLGFEISHFGGREYALRAVPDNLYSICERDLFLQILNDLAEERGQRSPDYVIERIASMSCKAAVKGNQRLSLREAQALIDELLTLENPYHCPHGRPVIISMSQYELEKKFKRIV
jgi:DNA mismatch repair protein MutL